jgi:hypothetical protein
MRRRSPLLTIPRLEVISTLHHIDMKTKMMKGDQWSLRILTVAISTRTACFEKWMEG